ncbi:MAG TPA: RNB domain-containing ribonuclease [Pyrinomonadaceae bacterium]|nr:RNB domain-containing ribonuclease [Pyrinomonadaceae bacterium]
MGKELNLAAIAHQAMLDEGFVPEFPKSVNEELESISSHEPSGQDLRHLLWSSIDDGKTRDLDQVEYAERVGPDEIRVLIGIADVDAFVRKESATDAHAFANCTSVYAGVKTFPMLPEKLSTDLTSLVANQDRLVVVTELLVGADGAVSNFNFYRATIRNQAKLSYNKVGAWLDGQSGPPESVTSVAGLEEQIRLQAKGAERLAEFRKKSGAIELGTIQAVPVIEGDGKLRLKVIEPNAARELISNFMIAANIAMAKFLEDQGGPSIRRVVRLPEHWDRIVEIAADLGEQLPSTPDARALSVFLERRKKADPIHFPDLSLAVVKALGPGEYTMQGSGEQGEGHFGLAADDYTHSTAPNRRYADLITQRLVKAALDKNATPYTEDELRLIATRCTERENASRKVERKMRKVAAAELLHDKVGEKFDAIVTGVSGKGTFARTIKPPVDGRVVKGERGLLVGQKVGVRLLSTNPERGFIDFAKA